MRFSDAFGPDRFGLSFELFPPKTEKGDVALMRHVRALSKFDPDLFTCTYGAGGATRDKTLDIVTRIREGTGISVAAHLTCVASTIDQLRVYLTEADRRGVENIVALRGDPPRDESQFVPGDGGLRYANELVALIRTEFPQFGIAVGGYPEKHQEAPSMEVDLANLKRKVDAGADVVLTQLFYDNNDFFRFRDQCSALRIDLPIVPGLLPVTNVRQVQRIASLCGAKMPDDFVAALENRKDDPHGQAEIGIDHAIRQTQTLINAGVPGIHFYVLNRSQTTARVLRSL